MIIYTNILHKKYVSIVIYFFSILTLNVKVSDENVFLKLFTFNVTRSSQRQSLTLSMVIVTLTFRMGLPSKCPSPLALTQCTLTSTGAI